MSTALARSLVVSRMRAVLVAVMALTSIVGVLAPAASATDVRAGDAVVVEAGSADSPLESGGSATVFGLDLPPGAACQGDSARDDYRIKSFLVPDTVDPGSLVYEELKPVGAGTWSLWAESTDPFVNGLTAQSDPGEPGLINLPQFSFGVLLPGELAPGEYRIGVACYLDGATTRFWDTSFVIRADAADSPAQFRWTALPPDGAGGGSSSDVGPYLVAGLALCLLVVLVLYIVLRRRSAPAAPTRSQEEIS